MVLLIKIIYGVLLILLGACIIKYRKQVHGWTGNFVWAEQYLGRGGTYLALILFGLACIFFGAIYPFGGMELITGK